MTTYISAKDTNKLIRQTLKAEFPNVTFSVKSRGNSTNVTWTDGPSYDAVDNLVGFYAGRGFDGMQDLTYSITHTTESGEEIHYGTNYVFCQRNISLPVILKFANFVKSRYALYTSRNSNVQIDFDYEFTIKTDYNGNEYLANPIYEKTVYVSGYTFEEFVYKLARENDSFESYMVIVEKENAERDAWYAKYNTERDLLAQVESIIDKAFDKE